MLATNIERLPANMKRLTTMLLAGMVIIHDVRSGISVLLHENELSSETVILSQKFNLARTNNVLLQELRKGCPNV